jgi:hypothetical protein
VRPLRAIISYPALAVRVKALDPPSAARANDANVRIGKSASHCAWYI